MLLLQHRPLAAEYGQQVDRESAYERLAAKLAPPPPALLEPEPEPEKKEKDRGLLDNPMFKTVATAAAATLGREIMRGIFGTRRRRRR